MFHRKKAIAQRPQVQPSAWLEPITLSLIQYVIVVVVFCLATLPSRAEEPCPQCVPMEIDRLAALLGDDVLRELVCRMSSQRYTAGTLATALHLPREGVMRRINVLRGWGLVRLNPGPSDIPVLEANPGNGVQTLQRWAYRYCPLGDGCGRPPTNLPTAADAFAKRKSDRTQETSPKTLGGDNGLADMDNKDGRYKEYGDAVAVDVGYMIVESPVGRLLVAASARGVRALYLGDRDDTLIAELKQKFPDARPSRDRALSRWTRQITRYLKSRTNTIDVPLDVAGTTFQRRVWAALREIPPGETRSYGDIAETLGDFHAARAVAQACAKNPVSILIPCHRVVRGDGSIGGYHWGVERKRALQDRESRVPKR